MDWNNYLATLHHTNSKEHHQSFCARLLHLTVFAEARRAVAATGSGVVQLEDSIMGCKFTLKNARGSVTFDLDQSMGKMFLKMDTSSGSRIPDKKLLPPLQEEAIRQLALELVKGCIDWLVGDQKQVLQNIKGANYLLFHGPSH